MELVDNLMETNDSGGPRIEIADLIHAVQYNDIQFVFTALDNFEMSPNSIDENGCTILHWAAINNRLEIASFLLEKGANSNAVGGFNKEIPLQWAVRNKKCSKLVELLILFGSDIHHKSIYGQDSLFIAVQNKNIEICYQLLTIGANPNSQDINGNTPLYWAIQNDQNRSNIDTERLLFSFGASTSIVTLENKNSLHLLSETDRNTFDSIQAWLIYKNCLPSDFVQKNEDGLTPYQSAVKTKNIPMIRFLYDAFLIRNIPIPCIIFSVVLLFLFPFFLIERYGFVFAASIYIPLLIILNTILSTTLVNIGQYISCGIAWGILIFLVATYFIQLSSSMSIYLNIFGVLISSFIIFSYLKSMTTKPYYLFTDNIYNR